MYVYLQEGDIFLWKTWKSDKLRENIPLKGYAIGLPSKKNIFPLTTMDGSWVRQKNPKYANYVTAFDSNFLDIIC